MFNLFHLQCGLDIVAVHPANEYISVIMSRPYHSSAKLGSHQKMRYRYIRIAIGNTPSQQLSRLTPFHKLQVLSILDLLCMFFMMTSRLGSGVLLHVDTTADSRTNAEFTNTNNLSPTREDSLLSMDATMTDGQMTLTMTIVTSGSNIYLVFTQIL